VTFRLFLVFAALVGINVYVFFYSKGSLKVVQQAAQAASTRAAEKPREPTPLPPSVTLTRREGALKEREGLGSALRREGLAAGDVDDALRALRPLLDFKRDLRAGQKYTLRVAPGGRLATFELRAGTTVYVVSRAPDGRLLGGKGTHRSARR
jgi:hypothetical protein